MLIDLLLPGVCDCLTIVWFMVYCGTLFWVGGVFLGCLLWCICWFYNSVVMNFFIFCVYVCV